LQVERLKKKKKQLVALPLILGELGLGLWLLLKGGKERQPQ